MGIYVGAGGVKTVNSLYVGAGGVKTVTAVYVGAGGTYKVWPDGVDILNKDDDNPNGWHSAYSSYSKYTDGVGAVFEYLWENTVSSSPQTSFTERWTGMRTNSGTVTADDLMNYSSVVMTYTVTTFNNGTSGSSDKPRIGLYLSSSATSTSSDYLLITDGYDNDTMGTVGDHEITLTLLQDTISSCKYRDVIMLVAGRYIIYGSNHIVTQIGCTITKVTLM